MNYALNWYGSVVGQSGYELLTRGLLMALDKLGVPVSLKNLDTWNRETLSQTSDITSRLKRMASTPMIEGAPFVVMQKWWPDVPVNDNTYIYSLFETDNIPKDWIPGFRRAKKVFTFSNFNYDKWSKEIVNCCRLGFGVEDCFRYSEGKANILNQQGFTFLSVGDYTERKGFDILLDAYCEEFTINDNITLILKIHRGGFTVGHKMLLKQEIESQLLKYSNHPKVLLLMDKLYYDDLPGLYNACDCFVLATRGEGLGLPVAEAMARGMPVIVTDTGGYMDFVNEGNGLTINSIGEQIESIDYIAKCPNALNHYWRAPDKNDLKAKMRYVFENRDKAKELGEQGRKDMFDKQWNDVAVQLLKGIFYCE